MLQRSIFIGLLLLAIATGTYFYLKPSPQALTLQALDYLNQSNVKAAESILNSLPAQSTACPIAFYKGCLSQTVGRLKEADTYFQAAMREPCKGKKEDVVSEILFAQAANAFLEGRDADFTFLVEEAVATNPSSLYALLFEGLVDYLHTRYDEALKSWSAFDATAQNNGNNPWINALVERVFSPSWRQIHMAHCLIEQGDLMLAKGILEKESARQESQNPEIHRLTALFLGFAYLKEGCQMPLDQRGSFYKLAHFYFERGGTSVSFSRERNLLITPVRLEAERLLLGNLAEEHLQCGFDLINILQKWNAQDAIFTIADRFSQKLLRQTVEENEALCAAVRREFMGTSFLTVLNQRLLDTLIDCLHEGKGNELIPLWTVVKSLSNHPSSDAKQLAALTAEEVFSAVKQDSETLSTTKQYIAFWQILDHSLQDQERLIKNLLLQAKLFWQKEGQESKGKELMALCLHLHDQHPSTLKEIETFLNDLYIRAEESNLIGRLSYIYDAMGLFAIQRKDLISPSKLANHLADADYLYHSQNFTAATTHAGWVLKLDPSNQHALKLVGLSSFHLGEYNKSFMILSRLSHLDEQCHKALVMSQIFATQEPAQHLAQIDPAFSFDAKGSE